MLTFARLDDGGTVDTGDDDWRQVHRPLRRGAAPPLRCPLCGQRVAAKQRGVTRFFAHVAPMRAPCRLADEASETSARVEAAFGAAAARLQLPTTGRALVAGVLADTTFTVQGALVAIVSGTDEQLHTAASTLRDVGAVTVRLLGAGNDPAAHTGTAQLRWVSSPTVEDQHLRVTERRWSYDTLFGGFDDHVRATSAGTLLRSLATGTLLVTCRPDAFVPAADRDVADEAGHTLVTPAASNATVEVLPPATAPAERERRTPDGQGGGAPRATPPAPRRGVISRLKAWASSTFRSRRATRDRGAHDRR